VRLAQHGLCRPATADRPALGFSLREVQPEVYLWQGEADTLVPLAMGKYQATQIPRCHATLLPGEGHLLIVDRMPDLTAVLRQTAPPR
jgi:pimeloyl-ACP methyl ester carboxylesterase